jgi:hypothetical protein
VCSSDLAGLLAAVAHATESAWRLDPTLLAAVEANGLGGCGLAAWDPLGAADMPEGVPLLLPAGAVPWAADAARWERGAFLRAHGAATAEVRLPAGQRQSGLLLRRPSVARYAAEARAAEGDASGVAGVLFGRAPESVLAAAEGLRGPAPLVAAGLTAPVLSLGPSGSGLPFHNPGAAWQTVLAGAKVYSFPNILIVCLRPAIRPFRFVNRLPNGAAGRARAAHPAGAPAAAAGLARPAAQQHVELGGRGRPGRLRRSARRGGPLHQPYRQRR